MNSSKLRGNARRSWTATGLLGTASMLAIAAGGPAAAQQQVAQAAAAPIEEVLVTGSLIHGAAAVGVPVTSLNGQDFRETGAISISDLLRTTTDVDIVASGSHIAAGASLTHSARVNIHGGGFFRTLVLYDGMRYPLTGVYADGYDPEILPSLAVDRVDVLGDGASATYGSDAVAGVVNVIMKRGFDGAIVQGQYNFGYKGGSQSNANLLFGRKWSSGDVTVAFSVTNREPIWAKDRKYYTFDFTPWGLDNRIPLSASVPATVSIGAATIASAAVNPFGTQGLGCTNCLVVPHGISATTVPNFASFTAMTATNNNLRSPWALAQVQGPEERTGASITFDQDVTNDIQFFADVFYANRKAPLYEPAQNSPWQGGVTPTAGGAPTLSTTNPYYPIGAPAGLRVNFSLTYVDNPSVKGKADSVRGDMGFNVKLPYDWTGKVFLATSQEDNRADVVGPMNNNNVLAALGNLVFDPTGKVAPFTVGTAPRVLTAAEAAGTAYAAGTNVRIISPSTVPFLNPFCDTMQLACVSPAQYNFFTAYWIDVTHMTLQQTGANFDGPLVDLPAGPMRAAVGIAFEKDDYFGSHYINSNTISSEFPSVTTQALYREIYSVYGQLNVPIFSDMSNIPGFQRLNLEISGRFDHYSDFGGTTNPKVSLDWVPIQDLTLRGAYGTSFRAPAFNELSPLTGKNVGSSNIGATNLAACATVGGAPVAGSAAAILNPTCSAALNFPALANMNGGAITAIGLTRPADAALGPEKADTASYGFDFAPTFIDELKGFDVQATYFETIVHGFLGAGPVIGGNVLQDPNALAQHYIWVKGDPRDPGDVQFNKILVAYTTSPQAAAAVAAAGTTILVLQDSMNRNLFRQFVSGVDWGASYEFDTGDLGLGHWKAGITGTTYLKSTTQGLPQITPSNEFDDPTTHTASRIRVKERAELGWIGDGDLNGLSATLFANYISHHYTTEAAPIVQLRTIVCPTCSAIDFQKIPGIYTFDLTLGYDTGDRFDNDYFKNIHVQLTAVNLLNKQPPFMYKTSGNGGNDAYDPAGISPSGRVVALVVTKNF